jgi:hypothetical protein
VTPTVGCLPIENTGAPGEVPLPQAIEGVAAAGAMERIRPWSETYAVPAA